ncbi:hypothetical protein SAMN05444166_4965 [Singulisphaera sp. GP187]|uniref:hypothetical protein n=1 Tax=Singulisphaera sp. GP187 TaxID=1882752 RepID=UPI00092768DD|nr:hypothetical protein [Singulisphaera sp. GP187]SIO46522.1 hypothetical protein SAMN05444166_4965 [Singulisphaera sp. GP187]
MLTRFEMNGRIDADPTARTPELIPGGQVCPAVVDPLSERASSNIALLYGGVFSRPSIESGAAPQRVWFPSATRKAFAR